MGFGGISLSILILSVSLIDSWLARANPNWYQSIEPPIWTPNQTLTIFILATVGFLALVATISLLFDVPNKISLWLISGSFALSGLTGAFLTNTHFNAYLVTFSLIEALFFYLAMIALIALTWKVSRFAAILLIPYSLWYAYSFYLNFRVWQLVYLS